MATVRKADAERCFSDKEELLRFLEEQDALTGFVFDPTATPQKARELMLACGVRPEENIFSRDIIQT